MAINPATRLPQFNRVDQSLWKNNFHSKSTNHVILLRCTLASTVLVVLHDLPGHDMLIRNRQDLPALLAMLVRTTGKVDTERALRAIFCHLLCSEGDAQAGRESSADPVSRVSVSGNGHHFRRTGKRLHSSLNPMDSDIMNVVFGKNGENGCISIAARGLFGGVRMDRDPKHDVVVEEVLAFFISGRRGGGMPWVGATLCTFPAFSLVPKNAMVDNPHGGPHLLTLRSCVSRCGGMHLRSADI